MRKSLIPEFNQPGFGQKIKMRGQGCNGKFQALCNLLNIQSFFFLDKTQDLYADMEVVDNASDENNENTRRKATVVPIKIEYV